MKIKNIERIDDEVYQIDFDYNTYMIIHHDRKEREDIMERKEIEIILKDSYRGKEILEYINKLEQALDKACEELSSLDYEIKMIEAGPHAYDCDYTNEDQWKEKLLGNE